MRLCWIFFYISLLTTTFAGAEVKKDKADATPPKDLMPLFQQVLTELEANYVEETNKEKLMEAAIGGMLSSLDPHSNYVNPKDFISMQESTEGEIIGIGMEFFQENGIIKVVAPIEDNPAAIAGVKAGDYIFKINGEPVLGMSTDEAMKKLRGGAVGSEVSVHIYRPGKDPFELKIKRNKITIKTVKSRLEGQVGYIRITSFMNKKTTDMVKEAIDSFKKTAKDGLQGIVIDLRNNAGGQIEQAVGLCSLFIDNVEVVSTRGRGSYEVRHYMTNSGLYVDPKLPVVVLINGGSASASEIIAGALQDHKRAIIMGTKSFGKASVQIFKPVMNDRAIKYTIARYYTPLGRSIQAQGIEPDILVDYMKFEKISDEGRFREKDYKGALKADPGLTEILKDKDKDKEKTEIKAEEKSPEEQDYPLIRALELVRSLAIYKNILSSHPTQVNQEKPVTKDIPKTPAQESKQEPKQESKPEPLVIDVEWKKYITPFENTEKKPTLSIILSSLGMKKELAEKAIHETPKNITLAFNPHSPELKDLCKKSRVKEHEILISLPLEPDNYPKEDPGPKTLLTRQSDEENLNRLNWALTQGESYLGLLNTNGLRFSSIEKSIALLSKTLIEKKIPYIDGTPTNTSKPFLEKGDLPYTIVDEQILDNASQDDVSNSFKKVIALSKANGHATIIVPPNPFVLKKLIEIEEDLKGAGIIVAPLSYVLLNPKEKK
jgi:carboxyl-terminal processing protease